MQNEAKLNGLEVKIFIQLWFLSEKLNVELRRSYKQAGVPGYVLRPLVSLQLHAASWAARRMTSPEMFSVQVKSWLPGLTTE